MRGGGATNNEGLKKAKKLNLNRNKVKLFKVSNSANAVLIRAI